MKGLEPSRLAALPPEDSVSTGFTTCAFLGRKDMGKLKKIMFI